MPSPSSYLPRPRLLHGKDTVHCDTPHTVHMPTAPCKQLQTKPRNKYILYFRYAMLFQKISEAEFQDICRNIMAQKQEIFVCSSLRMAIKQPRLVRHVRGRVLLTAAYCTIFHSAQVSQEAKSSSTALQMLDTGIRTLNLNGRLPGFT